VNKKSRANYIIFYIYHVHQLRVTKFLVHFKPNRLSVGMHSQYVQCAPLVDLQDGVAGGHTGFSVPLGQGLEWGRNVFFQSFGMGHKGSRFLVHFNHRRACLVKATPQPKLIQTRSAMTRESEPKSGEPLSRYLHPTVHPRCIGNSAQKSQ